MVLESSRSATALRPMVLALRRTANPYGLTARLRTPSLRTHFPISNYSATLPCHSFIRSAIHPPVGCRSGSPSHPIVGPFTFPIPLLAQYLRSTQRRLSP